MTKSKYYIVWIEGIGPRSGEKIHTLTDDDHTYTTKMTEAMRVKPKDVSKVREILKEKGIADWCVDSPNTFVPTSYAPSGTIWKA